MSEINYDIFKTIIDGEGMCQSSNIVDPNFSRLIPMWTITQEEIYTQRSWEAGDRWFNIGITE